MAIRITIEGIEVECDTAQEAWSFIKARNGVKKPQQQPLLFNNSSNELRLLSGTHKALLQALKEAYPTGLTSAKLASRLGRSPKSLPIIMVGVRAWAKRNGLNVDTLLQRELTFEKGKPISTYKITQEGIERLNRKGTFVDE